ncbi:MAG: DivIVA domain-containing protein, partial [Clostridiales bacterium]|nr:DivIVA domain-containing protein [Clostridiales bacterium]
MAIDIKKIQEITFSQSFRGYNTDEVDDYLDELYDGASIIDKKMKELEAKVQELESSRGNDAEFNDDSTNIIADAQITADEIISKATQKAQEILANAKDMLSNPTATPSELGAGEIGKLKMLIKETYAKQMHMIENISIKDDTEKKLVFEKVEEPVPFRRVEPQQSKPPSISFAGIVNKPDDKVQDVVREAAPKDIFSEISSIGLNDATQTFKAVEPQPV